MGDGVSFVIPNYNHAEQLKTSLKSVAGQTVPADEIIVVDDGSTDHSLQVIEAFAQDHPRIRLIKHPENQGVVQAVKHGVEAASTKYIILASADERVETNMVETLMRAIGMFPGARLAVSRFAEWYPERNYIEEHGPEADLGLWFHEGDEPDFIAPERLQALMGKGTVALQASTAIFERQALLDLGVYDPGLRWLGDWFTIHAIAIRHGVVVVPQTLAVFRRDEGSYSAAGLRNRRAQAEVLDHLVAKLDEPEFADIRDVLMRAPTAMSPFMNSLIRYAFQHLWSSRLCRATVAWWLRQVVLFQRPDFLRRLVHGSAAKANMRRKVT